MITEENTYVVYIIDELDELDKVSLVDKPAIERNFFKFSDEKNNARMSLNFDIHRVDDEQHIVSGALLIPDQPIYRHGDGEPFNVVFPRESIKLLSERFFKNRNTHNVNVEHSTDVDGVYMVESFIVDSTKGLSPSIEGEQYPNGTWFGSYKVENAQLWEEIKSGKYNGFSIEANVNTIKLSEYLKKGNQMKLNLKQLFKKTSIRLGQTDTNKGVLSYEGELVLDKEVYLLSGSGDPEPAPDGEYAETDGDRIITVEGGKITGIRDRNEQEVDNADSSETPVETFEETNQEVGEAISQLADAVNETVEAVNELEEKRAEHEEAWKAVEVELRSEIDALKKELIKLSKTPIAAPVKVNIEMSDDNSYNTCNIAPTNGLERFKK